MLKTKTTKAGDDLCIFSKRILKADSQGEFSKQILKKNFQGIFLQI